MPEYLERLIQQSRPDASQMPYLGILLALIVSIVAAMLMRLLYQLFYEERETGSQIDRSFLLISPAITTLFITIQFSLPLSLGLLGALSIVRFRVPIREPEEIGFLMVVIASAIACATYSYFVLTALLALVLVVLVIQHFVAGRVLGFRRGGGLLMLTVADAVYAKNAAAIEGVLTARLGRIRLEHLNGRDGVTTLNYAFRDGARADWSGIRRELEGLGKVDALSVLRAPQGGV
jgi:uncharacterized protein DUF4956